MVFKCVHPEFATKAGKFNMNLKPDGVGGFYPELSGTESDDEGDNSEEQRIKERSRTTWRLVCNNGSWTGHSQRCDQADLWEELVNRSCPFKNVEPNVLAFLGDRLVEGEELFPPKTQLVFRCLDIGKFSIIGSRRRKCQYGRWTGVQPACFGLNQENDYAREYL